MSMEDRRDQLLRILMVRYEEAQSQADFTAVSLARESGISRVWFYALVGKQFRNLRATLPGSIKSDETLVVKLRKEIAELRAQLKELRAKYESGIKEKFAEAIRHIELLDQENRMLRETLTVLEKRLNDDKLVIFNSAQSSTAIHPKDQI